jgi:parallel beta-helix repeat protein
MLKRWLAGLFTATLAAGALSQVLAAPAPITCTETMAGCAMTVSPTQAVPPLRIRSEPAILADRREGSLTTTTLAFSPLGVANPNRVSTPEEEITAGVEAQLTTTTEQVTTTAGQVTTTTRRDRSTTTTRPPRPTTTAAPAPTTTAGPSTPIPAGSVYIRPGDSLQAAVNSRPAGTVFVIGAGVHRAQSVVPKQGQQFIGEPGAVLDGENRVQFAIYAQSQVTDVVIKNLVIKNYATPLKQATVGMGGAVRWLVEGNEIAYNGAAGIGVASGMVVRNNKVHHNGQLGMISTYRAKGALVEGNDIYNNNTKNLDWKGGSAEAGGVKFMRTDGFVMRNNKVRDNAGPGLWLDWDNINAVYEGNVVSGNTYHGIFHERSQKAIIRNNSVSGNRDGGIFISASRDVEISGNTVSNNGRFGIAASQDSPTSGDRGPHVIENLWVHHNKVTMSAGWTGLQQQIGDTSFFTGRNNRFMANTYTIGSNSRAFRWMDNNRTWDEWVSYGNDTDSPRPG